MTDYCWNHDSVIIVWQYQQTSKNHGDTRWNSSSEVDEGNNRQGIGHHLLKATLQWWLRTITAVIPATEMGTNTTFSKLWMIGFWPQELRQLENLRAGFQAEGWREIFTIKPLIYYNLHWYSGFIKFSSENEKLPSSIENEPKVNKTVCEPEVIPGRCMNGTALD